MKNMIILLTLLLHSVAVLGDTPAPGTVKAKTFSGDGNTAITATSGGLDVNVKNSLSISSSSLPTNACQEGGGHLASIDTKLTSPLAVTGSFFPATQPVSGTFWQNTQPVSGTLTCNAGSGTQAVSLLSLPSLATGSNTIGAVNINGTVPISGTITATNSANGTTGTTAPTIATQAGGLDGTGKLQAIKVSSTGVQSVDGSGVTQPVSGSVTANAGTNLNTSLLALESGGHLANIDLKMPALGQALAAGSVPVVLTASQLSTLTPLSTITANAGTGTFLVDGSAHAQPVTGTFWQATQPVSGTFFQATQPVSAASLPLPTGASTSAKQPALGTAGTPSADVLTVQGSTSMTALKVDGSATTQPVSGTVTANLGTLNGAATSALQTTGNSSLTTIASNTGKTPVNANATLSARQTVTTTETNLSAPSNAVAAIIECESVNADNLRWGFSNSATTILSSTLGMLCEPGRSENIPIGVGGVLHMIATGAGSDFMDVQWVLSQ